MKKKGAKGAKSPFFNTDFKGLPKKAVRKKDSKGRSYYITEIDGKKKRISREVWENVKKAEKETKSRVKAKKSAKLIELPATLHRQFLSLCKSYIFERGFSVQISDIKKTYFKNGSFEFFRSMREMYNDLIKGMIQADEESGEVYAEESNDLIYFPYLDLVNKIISFNLAEVLLYNHPRKTETPLQLSYLKKFF